MLILSRTKDEQILIGDNVVITVVDIRGDKVRLGVDAPDEVLILRRELKDVESLRSRKRNGGRESD